MEKTFQENVLERLARIETKLSNGISAKQDDHEKRIRILERGAWAAIGFIVLAQIIISIAFK